jgi:hypothetical protein
LTSLADIPVIDTKVTRATSRLNFILKPIKPLRPRQ